MCVCVCVSATGMIRRAYESTWRAHVWLRVCVCMCMCAGGRGSEALCRHPQPRSYPQVMAATHPREAIWKVSAYDKPTRIVSNARTLVSFNWTWCTLKYVLLMCACTRAFLSVCVCVCVYTHRDLESSEELAGQIGALWSEEHLFRIDHYLGKELVQNLLVGFVNTHTHTHTHTHTQTH